MAGQIKEARLIPAHIYRGNTYVKHSIRLPHNRIRFLDFKC